MVCMWTYERISNLSTDEIQNLGKNARDRAAENVALLCEQILAEKKAESQKIRKTPANARTGRSEPLENIDESAIDRLAE